MNNGIRTKKLKIQIVGLGTVGLAQAHLTKKLGHEAFGFDVILQNYPSDIELVDNLKSDADMTFVCTPESEVEGVVANLKKHSINGLCVIKSTTSPGTTKSLMEKYDLHLCHNPEFLRERCAFEDVLKPSRIVVGECCKSHGEFLRAFYEPLGVPIYITTPTASELVKLATNSLRAVVITFWNEIHQLATVFDLHTEEIANLVDTAKTIGIYEGGNWGTRFFGEPFKGKCLPKDLEQLISAFLEKGLNPHLFLAVKESNEKIGGDKK